MNYYINYQSGRYKSTIDEFNSKEEAIKYCEKYQAGDHGRAWYYVSCTPIGNWK